MSDTRLIDAVKAENIVTVRELIDSGADVNQQDEQGWTPLNWASGRGNIDIVKCLLEKGADVFKTGRDLRTPYLIALAAGHAEVVKVLRSAEDQVEGEKPVRPERKYCKAYHLGDLRRYPAWSESRINWKEKKDSAAGSGELKEQAFTDDSVVFIHQDFTVTESMWHNENVLFNEVTPAWKEFCSEVLSFKVPDDLDLIASSKAAD